MVEALSELSGGMVPPDVVDTPVLRALMTIALWALVGMVLELLLRAVRAAGRASGTQIEEILSVDLRTPAWSAIGFAAAGDAISPWVADASLNGHALAVVLSKVARGGFVISVVWLLYRLARDLLRYAAVRATSATETMIDDMLLPIARTLLLPLALAFAAILALEAAGMPVESIAILVGGASFIIAFALQSTLEDIFGGVSLLVDTPFKYGDVLRLEDGTVADVLSLGLRVTHLYDAASHSVITVPNRRLAGERLTNLSRPTPDIKMSVTVTVPDGTPTKAVEERLLGVAHGHPYLLGPPDAKLSAMRYRAERMVLHGDHGSAVQMIRQMGRVRAEGAVNEAVDAIASHLIYFSGSAHGMEAGAFSRSEKKAVTGHLARLRDLVVDLQQRVSTWMLEIRYTYVYGERPPPSEEWLERLTAETTRLTVEDTVATDEIRRAMESIVDRYFRSYFDRSEEYSAFVADLVRAAVSEPDAAARVLVMGEGASLDGYFGFLEQESLIGERFAAGFGDASGTGIRDLHDVEEFVEVVRDWDRRTATLMHRLEGIEREIQSGSGVLLDELLYDLRRWLATDFKDGLPRWKRPSVAIVEVGDDVTYELKVYVDNVKLSHYTRVSKTEKQVRRDIVDLFRGVDPPIAFSRATIDVSFGDRAGAADRGAPVAVRDGVPGQGATADGTSLGAG